MRRAGLFGFVMLLSTSGRAAEHDWPSPAGGEAADQRVSLSLASRAGLVTAPFVTAAFPEVSGFGLVLVAGAGVQHASIGWLRAQLPAGFVSLDFPAGAQVRETVLGNLELGLEHRVELRPFTHVGFTAALLAPTATHGSAAALLSNRALAVASALYGGKESPLLTPGVTGLRLGGSFEHYQHPFGVRASVDLPLLLRLSDASLPEATETHSIGISPVVDLEGAVWVTSWFAASLGAGLVTELVRVQEPVLERDRRRRLQPVFSPGLRVGLGRHVTLGLDASVPVGASLGGEAWSVGPWGRFAF